MPKSKQTVSQHSVRQLTTKQISFTKYIFEGMNQREAYKKAYGANYAITTIDANASRLASNAKVQALLDSLRESGKRSTIMNVARRQEILTQIAESKLHDVDPDVPDHVGIKKYKVKQTKRGIEKEIQLEDRIAAIDLLNKLDGSYAPERHEEPMRRINIVFVMPDGTRKAIGAPIIEGEVKQLNGGNSEG